MYCTSCGGEMKDGDGFCARCGQGVGGPGTGWARGSAAYAPRERLMRDVANKKIAGVCAGIARHMDWDVTLVRVAFLALILFKGVGLLGYLIGWVAMPANGASGAVPGARAGA